MFHFNAKKLYLTYSQCELHPLFILEELKCRLRVYRWFCCLEHHKDGCLHSHMLLELEDKFSTYDERFWDIEEYHPHLKVPKTRKDVEAIIEYLKKEGEYWGNYPEKFTRKDLFNKIIKEGINRNLIMENPEVLALNFENLTRWLRVLQPEPIPVRLLPKKRHLWIHGPANAGKTSFLSAYLQLAEDQICQIPKNNDFCGFSELTRTAWIDEYKGQLTIQSLNELCDGFCKLNTKGGTTRILELTVVLVVSNYSIDECYHGTEPEIRETLRRRFSEYKCDYRAGLLPRLPRREL